MCSWQKHYSLDLCHPSLFDIHIFRYVLIRNIDFIMTLFNLSWHINITNERFNFSRWSSSITNFADLATECFQAVFIAYFWTQENTAFFLSIKVPIILTTPIDIRVIGWHLMDVNNSFISNFFVIVINIIRPLHYGDFVRTLGILPQCIFSSRIYWNYL